MSRDYSPNKIVITTVPFVDDSTPLAAPAVLKAALTAQGIDCVGLDLNIEIYNKIKHHPNRQWFLDFFYKQTIREEIVDDLVKMLDFYVEEIMSHRPNIVGLSLFCSQCQAFTLWLCAMLRHVAPEVKIVIGGPGLETLSKSLFKFPERLRRRGFIDDYITGDAETSLVEYMRGNVNFPGINSLSWQPTVDFSNLPIPDFSDYRFFRYEYPLLPIVDSRGCVQSCEFCDVIAFWEKFQYRSAENIFAQMQTHIKNYRVYRFHFASSICNGNLREFKKLVKLIADYNRSVTTEEQIHWLGSFIVRPASQHPESLWQLIKDSNGFLLSGVESVVERVRIGLGKRFTNEDLDHHLDMAKKFSVMTNLLMIAAYPTETVEEYEQSKQWFLDRKHLANDPVQKVQITLPGIGAGTKLEERIDKSEFIRTTPTRQQQGRELMKVIQQCGFNVQTFF